MLNTSEPTGLLKTLPFLFIFIFPIIINGQYLGLSKEEIDFCEKQNYNLTTDTDDSIEKIIFTIPDGSFVENKDNIRKILADFIKKKAPEIKTIIFSSKNNIASMKGFFEEEKINTDSVLYYELKISDYWARDLFLSAKGKDSNALISTESIVKPIACSIGYKSFVVDQNTQGGNIIKVGDTILLVGMDNVQRTKMETQMKCCDYCKLADSFDYSNQRFLFLGNCDCEYNKKRASCIGCEDKKECALDAFFHLDLVLLPINDSIVFYAKAVPVGECQEYIKQEINSLNDWIETFIYKQLKENGFTPIPVEIPYSCELEYYAYFLNSIIEKREGKTIAYIPSYENNSFTSYQDSFNVNLKSKVDSIYEIGPFDEITRYGGGAFRCISKVIKRNEK